MTYADPALVTARNYLIGRGVPGNSIGIVGDESHESTGGYHVGNDVLARIGKLHTDYSKRHTTKDQPGSNAAMALDVGGMPGQWLHNFTSWVIAQCRAGTADSRNIREVIGRRSPSGGVTRYDALGILADSGSIDHETHTHISYYRDSEGQDKTSLLRRFFEGTPTTTVSGGVKNVTTIYHLAGTGTDPVTNPGIYAMAGESPGTPANWLETADYQFAVDLVLIHHPPAFAKARTLSVATWEDWKKKYLSPLSTDAIEIENAPAGEQPPASPMPLP